jgi:hypothetical protein
MTKADEPMPINPEAEIVGAVDQPETMLGDDEYEDEGGSDHEPPGAHDEDFEGTAGAFEKKAEQAETDAAIERDLESTFPTSDPSSS